MVSPPLLVDRYRHRPRRLQQLNLLPHLLSTTSLVTLTDGFGNMKRGKHEVVSRFRRYNRAAKPSNWYRVKLMLYYPWYDEQTDLLGSYFSYEEHYRNVHSTLLTNEQKNECTKVAK